MEPEAVTEAEYDDFVASYVYNIISSLTARIAERTHHRGSYVALVPVHLYAPTARHLRSSGMPRSGYYPDILQGTHFAVAAGDVKVIGHEDITPDIQVYRVIR